MALKPENARIYGSDNDRIYLAPVGTTLPTDLTTAPGSAFEDVGWLHSDGIKETPTGSKEVIRGHQGQKVVRTRMNEPGTTIGFHALETKSQTQSLRYYEKTAATTAGVRKATRSPGQRVSARAAVIDLYDADNLEICERWVIPRLEVTPDGERVFAGTDIAGFPFLGEIIGDYEHFSSDTSDK